MPKLKLPRSIKRIHKIWRELGSQDGWTIWPGGMPPVSPDDEVGIKFKNQKLRPDCVKARGLDWKHWGSGTDITAYKIIFKARKKR